MSRAPTAKSSSEVDEYIASWHATMKLLREGKSFSGRERNCAFLNCGDSRFANVSSVSGLDFADDGRAVASIDWDHDGDLDLWIHNRTGPRLRFLRNQVCNSTAKIDAEGPANFIAFRLQGVQSNRDAIGARVTLKSSSKPQTQSLYAGDAYLSQSSKWLHFGLKEGTTINGITVRWPNGKREDFPAVQAGSRYHLVEGSGVAVQVRDRSPVRLDARPQLTTKPESIRAIIANPVPLPILEMNARPNQKRTAIRATGRPLLVVVWASSCPHCMEELTRLASKESEFKKVHLDLLALNIDALALASSGDEGGEHIAAEVLRRIGFPYKSGDATSELMDKIQIVQRIVLNRPLPSAVPMMLLVNRNNELAGIYQGVQSTDSLLRDVEKLDSSVNDRRNLAVPFPGRWTTPPDVLLIRPVANVFREAGYRNDFEHFLMLDRRRLAQLKTGAASDSERRQWELRFANDSLDIALSLLESGRANESLDYFREGLQIVPDSANGHFQFGRALAASNQQASAIREYQATLDLDQAFYNASFELGVHSTAENRLDDAAEHFRKVTAIRPKHVAAWTNLGVVLARMKRSGESIRALTTATELDSENVPAWLALGGQLAGRGDYLAASKCFRTVTELKPEMAKGYAALGQALVKLKQDIDASKMLKRAVELNSRDAGSRLQLAWLQATSPIESVRDGHAAVQIATDLLKQTANRDPRVLDVMGVALAETGEFKRAIEFTKMAMDRIPPKHPLRPILRGRINGYKANEPFRDR